MIVCHCHSVNERTIRESVRAGAEDANEVGDHCRAGTGCGGCVELVEVIVRSEQLVLRCAARIPGRHPEGCGAAVLAPASARTGGRSEHVEAHPEPVSASFG